ncbi:alpha/beta fold hydrolase [Streptomyces sp. NRRL F-5126]|uniref:alpha/beta fold hydrolase n=1 Tax=Streptomyces sp. NRRL F-5126 TaxID=1463857 RepID=UPI0004C5B8FC|nr:alpha/beta hydrolase [Streptomyces sp. NRRL F-5126]
MPEVTLSAGTIEYEDTAHGETAAGETAAGEPRERPTLVLLHGLTMDSSVWHEVVADLGPGFRCVRPTLPLGAHRIPMRDGADLTLRGMALLVGEFLEALDLRDVTLVLNDWGGAQVLLSQGRPEVVARVGRLVLTACEAFDNYPPGLPGRLVAAACRAPATVRLMMEGLRFRALRRAPGGWGWMSRRPVPGAMMDAWFTPGRVDPLVRRDLAAYVLSVPDRATLLRYADGMRTFDRPVLVVWAKEDRLMPRAHGPRLAALFPDARLVELDDTYTLIPIDQPHRLAELLRDFTAGRTAGRTRG